MVLRSFLLALLLGMFVGYFSWGHSLSLTILSLSLFLAYMIIDKRYLLFGFVWAYYLMASRGFLFGVESYYENLIYAFLAWIGVATVSSLLWVLIWTRSFRRRLSLFPLLLIVMILPPFGFISWVNPLPSIAVVLPGFGFLGLVLELIFIYLVAILWKKYDYARYYFMTLMSIIFISTLYYFPPKVKENLVIKSIQSDIEYFPMTFDKSREYRTLKTFFYKVQNTQSLNILLPENALGNYSSVQSMLWQELDEDRTVFAGATIYNARRSNNINALLEIDHNSTKLLYKQRVPVLGEMWKPFRNKGTEATIFEQAIVKINGEKAGVFICYEQLLVYPYLQTFFYKPNILIGISNLYWAKGTNIKSIQKETMELWAILFGVPLSFSVNG
ncbi:MAG: Conjugal transfer protein TraB [uncultured Sulfurovum sp.]|uniref:Conjugal transfer protein TraB n=1 Tax=uncultured Sulfurovum sp. TaxID=269237 RepID=A0A6S6SE82_9BACT|nr:MAG: Conjugal transfer protein TraB [uncultured Sulfurovum sp.]